MAHIHVVRADAFTGTQDRGDLEGPPPFNPHGIKVMKSVHPKAAYAFFFSETLVVYQGEIKSHLLETRIGDWKKFQRSNASWIAEIKHWHPFLCNGIRHFCACTFICSDSHSRFLSSPSIETSGTPVSTRAQGCQSELSIMIDVRRRRETRHNGKNISQW